MVDCFGSIIGSESEVKANESLYEDANKMQKKKQLHDQYTMLFASMLEIIDVISEQIYEKMSTIPYPVRQFCKCLYQAVREKISGRQAQSEFDVRVVRVVASFVLEKWLLKSIFVKLHLEGLIKEFILPKNCVLNL